MSRPASPATEIKNLRSVLRRTQKELADMTAARNAYRVRAQQAEQDAAAWRERFDLLLRQKTEVQQ